MRDFKTGDILGLELRGKYKLKEIRKNVETSINRVDLI